MDKARRKNGTPASRAGTAATLCQEDTEQLMLGTPAAQVDLVAGFLEATAAHGYGPPRHIEVVPARPARFQELGAPLPEHLAQYLTERGMRLWKHQAQVINAVRDGANVVVATSTASGKTLAFNLATFERLSRDPEATALYLYPMKALANDQLVAIADLDAATGARLAPAVYDGDTPQSQRAQIRATSRLVITNPYGLHQYLPHHHLWERLFSHLSVVVVDEAHWYRGVLGSNVAMLLRRLRRIAAHYGAYPQFVLSSATIGNPAEHAEKLVGLPHRVVDDDGAPHGPKHFILWDSVTAKPDRSPHRQAADLLALLANAGHKSLCFTGSRQTAELVARWAGEAAPGRRVVPYRAGYFATDRREVEQGLRDGTIHAVASTDALELGVDIGDLGAVVIAGYPGTICSTWQQAGRAGRNQAPSLVVLVAFDGTLDQYIVAHPEELFGATHEQAVVDLANPKIVCDHVMCASAEVPITAKDAEYFDPELMWDAVDILLNAGVLAIEAVGGISCKFCANFRPVAAVSLNAIDGAEVAVQCEGRTLEMLDKRRALSMAYPGALFLHQGSTYRVQALDLSAGTAYAVREWTDAHTEVVRLEEVWVEHELASRSLGIAVLHFGTVRVVQHFPGYRVIRYDEVVSKGALHLPSHTMSTTALWLTLPDELAGEVQKAGGNYSGGLHAIEHGLCHMMPLLAMCDRNDIAGVSTTWHPGTGQATVFLYDDCSGGQGIADKAYEQFDRLVQLTLAMLSGCHCDTGCPACVYDRRCGSDNQPMDRRAAVGILARLQPSAGSA